MDDEDNCKDDVDDVHGCSHSCETRIDQQKHHDHCDDDISLIITMICNMYDNMINMC